MMARPYLILHRLVVTGHGRNVYDETFHVGVNIIRGENSSGKSTISDLIFFVLGGENVDWTEEAESCDMVFAEFDVSGQTICLRREISTPAPSISVAEGYLKDNLEKSTTWSVYGRQRSERRESFSQLMFQRLGFPETKSDDSSANITMYQVLRLLYSDQNTDNTSLFRRERQQFADRQDVRRSIGEMLLGIDDLRGHELRQDFLKATKLHAAKKARLDSMVEAAMKTDPNFAMADYSDMIGIAQQEQSKIEEQTNALGNEEENQATPAVEISEIKRLQAKVSGLNENIAEIEDEIQSLELNILDSELFIASLQSDLSSLLAANNAREIVGKVSLIYCPICLGNINEDNEDHCPLCKASYTGDAITGGRLRYSQELKHQIGESVRLLGERSARLAQVKQTLKSKVRDRNNALSDYRVFVVPTNRISAEASQLLKHHGYLTRLIEDLGRLEAIQSEIGLLESEVANIQRQIDALDREIKLRQVNQESRRSYCQQRIGDLTIEILHKDIVDSKNDTLRDAQGLVFSFEKDFLSVRHGRLSASTQVFLKNSFYLALLMFAIEDDECRLPKFFILDNIEDKGMVPDRFRKFHHLLVQYSESVETPHQVILTTSYIDSALNNTRHCVGPSYDHPPYTLDLKGEWVGLRGVNGEALQTESGNQ